MQQHELHERMRPWISKKITEFLGEEETTLVDYIVSSTQEHMKASQMLELLQSILDDEAEMFVLKMWRMLIYEIKRVEMGVASKWNNLLRFCYLIASLLLQDQYVSSNLLSCLVIHKYEILDFVLLINFSSNRTLFLYWMLPMLVAESNGKQTSTSCYLEKKKAYLISFDVLQ